MSENLPVEHFKGALSGLRQFLATESPLKLMKKILFHLKKLFSFSRYLSFCHEFLVIHKSGMIRKKKVISKFMT